jgi:hypothetical protein
LDEDGDGDGDEAGATDSTVGVFTGVSFELEADALERVTGGT